MSKQKTIKTEKLVFYNLIDSDKPLLFFDITGGQNDVDEATGRIRNQVLKMQNGIWEEKSIQPNPMRKYQY